MAVWISGIITSLFSFKQRIAHAATFLASQYSFSPSKLGNAPLSGPSKILTFNQILVHSYGALERRWTVSECAVKSVNNLLITPPLD